MNSRLEVAHGTRHVGIVVEDIKISRKFYEAIGFVSEGSSSAEMGESLSRILDVRNASIVTEKFTLNVVPKLSIWREEGFRLELVEYTTGESTGVNSSVREKNNTIGKVHICFSVSDLALVLNNLKNLNFNVSNHPYRHRNVLMTYLFDPNGVSIELIQKLD